MSIRFRSESAGFLIILLLYSLTLTAIQHRTLIDQDYHATLIIDEPGQTSLVVKTSADPGFAHTPETASGKNSTVNARDNHKGKWAYTFLMAGVDPHDESHNGKWYHGILFNAIVTAELLYNNPLHGSPRSKADVILMVQLSKDSNATSLPEKEEEWLKRANIIVKYIPLPSGGITQSFYTIQFEKFRILQLYRDYSRVLFLDGDVIPHCNMDYLFELSERSILKENVILAWRNEPASGGFFMLTPSEGDYEALEAIIENQHKKALERGILFDHLEGWGQKIIPPDFWVSSSQSNGTQWRWHGDFVDQGLLYFWVKYYKKNVSIIQFDKTQQWGSIPFIDKHGQETKIPILESVLEDNEPFRSLNCSCRPGDDSIPGSSRAFFTPQMLMWPSPIRNIVPLRDFVHFSGTNKPWTFYQQHSMNLTEILGRVEPSRRLSSFSQMFQSHRDTPTKDQPATNLMEFRKPQEIWLYTFWKAFRRLGISDYDTTDSKMLMKAFHERLDSIGDANHGGFPTTWQAVLAIQERFGQNTSHINQSQ